jgi:hypothetical protein
MVSASDTVRPAVVERVSPTEFKVVSGDLQYAAAVRAAELNPNFELRSVVVEKGTPRYDAVMRQEAAYKEVAKLSEDATLARTSLDTPTYEGTKTEKQLRTTTGSRTLDLETVTTARGGAYSTEAVDKMAQSFLETGGNIRPIVVRRTSPTDFELIRGNLEYLAAKRAAEIDPQFTGVRALIVDSKNEAAVLRQLDILDEGIPVSTAKPVVVSDAPFTSLSDLVNDARDGSMQSLSEVRNWSQKGDFSTKLKDIPNAVDDLGIDALNTPSLMKVVKGRAGKLSNKVVKEVSASLVKVDINKAEDISKSLFDALWRKSTDGQKQTILSSIPSKRLNELGLERVETKVTPPTLPTLAHTQAEMVYHGAATEIQKFDDGYYSSSNIYGNGFYTTKDSAVANSYRKKNASDKSQSGYLYGAQEKNPQKLYDLDRKIVLDSEEGKAIRNHLRREINTDSRGLADLADDILQDLKSGHTPTLGKMFDFARHYAGDYEDMTSFIDSFRKPLESFGFSGYTHEGGVLTGNKSHQVNIYWKTENNLAIKQLDPPPYVDGYHVVNDSQASLESLRYAVLKEQRYSNKDARAYAKYYLQDEISETAAVSDKSLDWFLTKDLKASSVAERDWSSKMLQQVWDVATPAQKARIMSEIDAKTLEKLGFERIARSNVIDDHLPIEKEFDTPC